jgi:hypothetical protein
VSFFWKVKAIPVSPNNSKVSKKLIKAAVVHKSLLGIKKKYDALFNQNINGLAYCKIILDLSIN